MRFQSSLLGTLTLATLTLAPLAAHATGVAEVSTTGKGTIGGAMLGAEVVLLTEAAFKTQPTWAYLVGGGLGAVGGGITGHFIEKSAAPRTTMFILAGGMALVIPTAVAVLSATAYEPPSNYTQDKAPVDEPVAEPPQPASGPLPSAAPPPNSPAGTVVPATPAPPITTPSTPTPTTSLRKSRARRALPDLDYHLSPPSLIGISAQALTFGIPAVELSYVYSRTELAMYGVTQATEVRVPLLNVLF